METKTIKTIEMKTMMTKGIIFCPSICSASEGGLENLKVAPRFSLGLQNGKHHPPEIPRVMPKDLPEDLGHLPIRTIIRPAPQSPKDQSIVLKAVGSLEDQPDFRLHCLEVFLREAKAIDELGVLDCCDPNKAQRFEIFFSSS